MRKKEWWQNFACKQEHWLGKLSYPSRVLGEITPSVDLKGVLCNTRELGESCLYTRGLTMRVIFPKWGLRRITPRCS